MRYEQIEIEIIEEIVFVEVTPPPPPREPFGSIPPSAWVVLIFLALWAIAMVVNLFIGTLAICFVLILIMAVAAACVDDIFP